MGSLHTSEDRTLTIRPIGFIRTGKSVKFQARHQPLEDEPERNVLELVDGHGYELALRDLAGFSRVWLLWWFDRNTDWRPLVLPPRGPARRRGVFATRSPHRPNPLGLTPVTLIAVQGRQLVLGPCDLTEGTPVFDIKPYIPAYDAFPDAAAGWHAEVDAMVGAMPLHAVGFRPLAQTQATWLQENWGIDFRPRLVELLSRDPSLHRGRGIRRRGEDQRVIGCGAWRAVFQIEGQHVWVESLEASYALRFLNDPLRLSIPDRAAQVAFIGRWPERPLQVPPRRPRPVGH